MDEVDAGIVEKVPSRWQLSYWLSWTPTSMALLAEAERKILAPIWHLIDNSFVKISNGTKVIRTIVMNKVASGTPLVMVHGFGSGVGLWVQNLESLSKDRPVYAFDVLGFGRSTRSEFSKDAILAEMEFVDSIENWRQAMKLDKFILLGHSLGGFLASSYALHYPERVKHLILVEPWGYSEKQSDQTRRTPLPIWVRIVARLLEPFNPLAGLRLAGPMGPGLVKRFRPDLIAKYSKLYDDDTVSQYIYHCNAQHPSGETAFRMMTIPIGWARHPMITRIERLAKNVPVTFIYGSRSWMDSGIGQQVKYMRSGSYVDVQVISAAGHHVYVDKLEQFNKIINQVGLMTDHGVGPGALDGNARRKRNRSESMQTSFSINDLPSMAPPIPHAPNRGLASSASESVLLSATRVDELSREFNALSHSIGVVEEDDSSNEPKEMPRDIDAL